MTTLNELGENALVERIVRMIPPGACVVTGPGDDAAVVRAAEGDAEDLVLTSDPLIEGVHFAADAAPADVGRKAIGRVLSDIGAMGARPRWALVNLCAPGERDAARIEALYAGAVEIAGTFGMAIVGGDVCAAARLELHAFGVGSVPRGTAVLRSGARPADWLYVTGRLGGSAAGRHLRFTPRVAEGIWLREGGWATAMMDISDGLAADLPRLAAASRVGARVLLPSVPVSEEAARAADGRAGVDHALSDGEDYELLFTVPRPARARFESAWADAFRLPCACIGEITGAADGLRWEDATGGDGAAVRRGYEHFR